MKPVLKEPFHPRSPREGITISEASQDEIGQDVLRMFDDSIKWLVEMGISSQWGTEARSNDEKFQQRVQGIFDTSIVLQARSSTGHLLGIIGLSTTSSHPGFIPAPPCPELYISVLIRNRQTEEISSLSRGVGRILVEQGKEIARENGIRLMRVDCFGGEGGELVRVYEGYGFRRAPEDVLMFERWGMEAWPMQVLELWLD